MAKSKFDITPEIIEEIKELAASGLQLPEIWEYYAISKSTWYAKTYDYEELKKQEDPEFFGISDIIKQSRAKRGAKAAKKLWEYIDAGGKLGLSALIFYLKTRHGWSEKNLDLDESGNQPPHENNYKLQTLDPIQAARIYQKIMEK